MRREKEKTTCLGIYIQCVQLCVGLFLFLFFLSTLFVSELKLTLDYLVSMIAIIIIIMAQQYIVNPLVNTTTFRAELNRR